MFLIILGAPWHCNHITVVPLLPSVVYRNCKQRGICDLVFWIRDAAPPPPRTLTSTRRWGSVAGSEALHGRQQGCTVRSRLADAGGGAHSLSLFLPLSAWFVAVFLSFSVSVSRGESIVSSIACTTTTKKNKTNQTTLDNTAKKKKNGKMTYQN